MSFFDQLFNKPQGTTAQPLKLTGSASRYLLHSTRYVKAVTPGGSSDGNIAREINRDPDVPKGMVYYTFYRENGLVLKRKQNFADSQANPSVNIIGRSVDNGNGSGDFLGWRKGDPLYTYRVPVGKNTQLQRLTEFGPHVIGSFNGYVIPSGITNLRQLFKRVGLAGDNHLYSDNGSGISMLVSGGHPVYNNGNTDIHAGDLVVDRLPDISQLVRDQDRALEPACAEYPAGRYPAVLERLDPSDVKLFAELALTRTVQQSETGTPAAQKATDLSLLFPTAEGKYRELSVDDQFTLRMRQFVAGIAATTLLLTSAKDASSDDKAALVAALFTGKSVANLPANLVDEVFKHSLSGLFTDKTLAERYDASTLLGSSASATASPQAPTQAVRTAQNFAADPAKLLRSAPVAAIEAYGIAYNELLSSVTGRAATSGPGGDHHPFNLLVN